ncbi:MAG: TIGR03032 family protein [Bacteroidales bacterium]|nr:TIGR03032 family protein [Bacteroidales bacterium]
MNKNNSISNKGTKKSLAPFSCQYTPQIPELLLRLNCSLAISTYQAGKLIFLSPKDENSLIQLPRTFAKPMGIAEDIEKDKIALACKDEIIVFSNSSELALHYSKSPNKYDALYMPRVTYHTGPLDIHDLRFSSNGNLFAVNTLFSCIIVINGDYNFSPYWTPPFIDKLASEDRCHLNGIALKNGKPRYATAFNQGNSFQSWRENITKTGVIFDLETNEVIAENLAMPHSPRLFGDDLYVLLSATGELIKINITTGKYDVIVKFEGFVRGMSLHKNYLFIGLSKLRKNSSTFGKLDFAEKANQSGIMVIHLPTGSIAGKINYLTSLDEIYDVHVIPDKIRPNILNTITNDYKSGLMTPKTTFWAKSRN